MEKPTWIRCFSVLQPHDFGCFSLPFCALFPQSSQRQPAEVSPCNSNTANSPLFFSSRSHIYKANYALYPHPPPTFLPCLPLPPLALFASPSERSTSHDGGLISGHITAMLIRLPARSDRHLSTLKMYTLALTGDLCDLVCPKKQWGLYMRANTLDKGKRGRGGQLDPQRGPPAPRAPSQ